MRLDRHHVIEGGEAERAPEREDAIPFSFADRAEEIAPPPARAPRRVRFTQAVEPRYVLALVLTTVGVATVGTAAALLWSAAVGLLVVGSLILALGVMLGLG